MTLIKKCLIFILGLILFGLGVSLCIRSGFGNNPMASFAQGVSLHIALSVGTVNMLTGLLEIAAGFMTERKNVTLATFIAVFCGSYSIDLGNLIFPVTKTMSLRIIYMICGIILYCLGFAFQQLARCGFSHYDCFIFGLAKQFSIKDYALVRRIADLVFLVIGYFLGGAVGVATIVLMFASGRLILFFKKNLLKVFDL